MSTRGLLPLLVILSVIWQGRVVGFPGGIANPEETYAYHDGGYKNATANDGRFRGTISIAFLGNSLQFYNDLPRLVGEIFEYSGYSYRQANFLRDGANFKNLWDRSNDCRRFWARFCPWFLALGSNSFLDMIDTGCDGSIDYIVMNDHTQHPARQGTRDESIDILLKEYVPLFAEEGITPILYQTFAYRDEGISGTSDLGNFSEFTRRVQEGYKAYELAMNGAFRDWFGSVNEPTIQATTAPVGRAFAEVRATNKDLWSKLYSPDGIHPQSLGTLLVAYSIFWTITGEAPPEDFHLRWLWSWRRIRQGWDPCNTALALPTEEEAKGVWFAAEKAYRDHNADLPLPF